MQASDTNTPHADRSRLAEDRTILAAERTYAAWLRTGLAFLSVGLAMQRFLGGTLPPWTLATVGVVMTTCAAASFAAAGWRDWYSRRRLAVAEIHLLPLPLTLGLSGVLAATSLLAEAALLLS